MSRVGVGLRRPHLDAFADPAVVPADAVDFLEINPENYVGRGGRDCWRLHSASRRWPVHVHGVALSVGGPDPFDEDYLVGLRRLLDELGTEIYTDHLCWTSAHGYQTHELVPLPWSPAAVEHCAARIRSVSARLARPVAVENIAYYCVMPGSTLDEPAFVRAVCEQADCSLLLDLNNLLVNAHNFDRDPLADLDRYPLDRVVQVHLAGHRRTDRRWLDTHDAPIDADVLALATALQRRVPGLAYLVEWDQHIPPVSELLAEVGRVRAAVGEG